MNDQYHENFIRVYDNAVTPEFCTGVIRYFEWCLQNNRYWNRQEDSLLKKDQSSSLAPLTTNEIIFSNENLGGFLQEFNNSFWDQCYKNYMKEFDVLKTFDRHTIHSYKLQKTLPGGGYHVWHCENGTRGFMSRIGVYLLYLNDVIEGGETEFLYQNTRVKPKQGTLVIWPAGYTHPHRGNPPLIGAKYVMTGWIELA